MRTITALSVDEYEKVDVRVEGADGGPYSVRVSVYEVWDHMDRWADGGVHLSPRASRQLTKAIEDGTIPGWEPPEDRLPYEGHNPSPVREELSNDRDHE